MNKLTQFYRELVLAFSERLREGERDIDALLDQAKQKINHSGALTEHELASLMQAVRRDLQEFAHSYQENRDDLANSVFMRVIKQSLWQDLADITDQTQLEWHEMFDDIDHQGIYHSGDVVGLGNMICEICHYRMTIYAPEILPHCPQCGGDRFQRIPFNP
ncbi:zinc ribbon-containing protein [Enterobacteriaceae bacterium ESL0689]|nr:zinc ribbon-containing protein [Enterobacteriaceae bacterium ESL0689]